MGMGRGGGVSYELHRHDICKHGDVIIQIIFPKMSPKKLDASKLSRCGHGIRRQLVQVCGAFVLTVLRMWEDSGLVQPFWEFSKCASFYK